MSSEARSISCESPFNGGSCNACFTNWGSQFYAFFNRVRGWTVLLHIFWQFLWFCSYNVGLSFIIKPTIFIASQKTNKNFIIFNFYQCSVVKQDQFITYLLSDAPISASSVLWCSRIHRHAAVPIVLHINKQCVYCMYCTQNLPFLLYVFPSSMQKIKQSASTCARKVGQSLQKLGKVIFQAWPIHFIQGRRKFCQKSS